VSHWKSRLANSRSRCPCHGASGHFSPSSPASASLTAIPRSPNAAGFRWPRRNPASPTRGADGGRAAARKAFECLLFL
jgi:hypothetical protein